MSTTNITTTTHYQHQASQQQHNINIKTTAEHQEHKSRRATKQHHKCNMTEIGTAQQQ